MSILHVHEHPDATEHHNSGPHEGCACRVCILQRKVLELEDKIEGLENEVIEMGEQA